MYLKHSNIIKLLGPLMYIYKQIIQHFIELLNITSECCQAQFVFHNTDDMF